MLLRSSSTPLLGSLLASIPESPNNNNISHHESNTNIKHLYSPSSSTLHQSHNKLSSVGFLLISCNSSPFSTSITTNEANKGFRRAQSEGNLKGLAYASCNTNNDEPNNTNLKPKKVSGRTKCSMLERIPSFSFHNSKGRREEEDDDSDVEDDKEIQESLEEEIEEAEWVIMAMDGGDISVESKKENMESIEEMRSMEKWWNLGFEQESGLFLARGLGIDGGGGGGSGEFNHTGSGGDGGDSHSVEEYYQKIVEENPGNPLFLRNYAQFLYQSKQDLKGAEEYYSRAILVCPNDGDLLSKYAELVWELYHDQDRASIYFERAVQASPEDSHVHASYANFLWETEEDEDECNVPSNLHYMPSQFCQGALASANA